MRRSRFLNVHSAQSSADIQTNFSLAINCGYNKFRNKMDYIESFHWIELNWIDLFQFFGSYSIKAYRDCASIEAHNQKCLIEYLHAKYLA